MPSIPQSLLWISLVVLWLFVLVPMLISKRDAVRRTSDVALATRVLNGGASARLLKRTGPAAGHRSDPDWRPEEQDWDDEPTAGHFADADAEHAPGQDDDHEAGDENDTSDDAHRARPIVLRVPVAESTEPDYLDVDVVEDGAALPVGASAGAAEPAVSAQEPAAEDAEPADDEVDYEDDRYEYVEDSSGLEPEEEDHDGPFVAPVASRNSRTQRYDRTAAAVTARKYVFRRRVLMAMAVVLVVSAVAAFNVTDSAWWLFGTATTVTVFYLGYLRRQTRIEERIRRRRAHRMARARAGVENARDREYDVVPARLRRPGAVVLEIDDEDPVFEHLEYAMAHQNYGWPRDLPRAVGE